MDSMARISDSMDAWTKQDDRWAAWWAGRYTWMLRRCSAFDYDDLLQAARVGLLTAKGKWPAYRDQHQQRAASVQDQQPCIDGQTSAAPAASASQRDTLSDLTEDDRQTDLAPSAMMGSMNAQRAAWSTFSAYYIRNELRALVGIRHGNELPPFIESLDVPLSEDSETTLADLLPDSSPPVEDQISDIDTREAVAAAVNRIPDDMAREAVTLFYLEGVPMAAAAALMGISLQSIKHYKERGLSFLRRDRHLKSFIELDSHYTRWIMPWGISTFNSTMKSSVDAIVEARDSIIQAAVLHRD